jgi:thiosulfate dehydrogenase (quinone) large subunit
MTYTLRRFSLVLLRTLIGWHFIYEGYFKLMLPGWTSSGPVGRFSAAGYLNAATGPLAGVFHSMAHSRFLGPIDLIVPVGLVLVGVSLVVGLFTQIGCVGAAGFLTLFYLSAMPTSGMPQTGAEGAYLLVSKNLIELVAVLVVFAFRTGEIAGLDLLWQRDDGAAEVRLSDSPVHLRS